PARPPGNQPAARLGPGRSGRPVPLKAPAPAARDVGLPAGRRLGEAGGATAGRPPGDRPPVRQRAVPALRRRRSGRADGPLPPPIPEPPAVTGPRAGEPVMAASPRPAGRRSRPAAVAAGSRAAPSRTPARPDRPSRRTPPPGRRRSSPRPDTVRVPSTRP